jgi:hypothetical protein
MANHALVAVLGLQIGMLAEKVRDLGFDRLRQQGSSSVAQDFGELVVEHNSISADSRLPPLRNVAWPSRLRLLAPLQSVSDLSRHWFVECGDGKMRAPRSAVVNCTATFAPPALIWIKLARQSWCNLARAISASARL